MQVSGEVLNSPDYDKVTLSNGLKMPKVGFGTWKLNGTECYD